jgi:membrane fusion protein (multidrug efflux system)
MASPATSPPGKGRNAKAEASIPVEVAKPLRGEMLAMYSGTATLDAEADAEVVAKVGGEVRRIYVEEGDRVTAGQVLARSMTAAAPAGRADACRTRASPNAISTARWNFTRRARVRRRLRGLKYDLDNQRAADDIAQLSLSYSEIRAPFAGIVSAASREARSGNRESAPASFA